MSKNKIFGKIVFIVFILLLGISFDFKEIKIKGISKKEIIKSQEQNYFKIINYKGLEIIDNQNNNKDILLMFPNISGKSPYMFGDFACENKNYNTDKCYGIFSYKFNTGKNYSPFTNLISNNGQYRVIQFNYPNEMNNIKEIVNNYLKDNGIDNTYNINIYGQSMGGRIAIIIASYLSKKGYKINNLYINSAPILSKDVIYNIYPNLQSWLYYIAGYIRTNYLYGIISADPNKEKNINIDKNEINKIIRIQQLTFRNKNAIYNKLSFLSDNNLITKAIKNIKVNGNIYLIISYPPNKYKNNNKDDGLIKHLFINSFLNYINKKDLKKVRIIKVKNVFHSTLSEYNLRYYDTLKKILVQ